MTGGAPAGRARDPARGLRAIGAAILTMHAITMGLAVPVVATRSGGGRAAGIAMVGAIAVLDLVAAALLRRAEQLAVVMGSALQVSTIAAGVFSGVLVILGVLFGGVWVGWLAMRRSLAAARRRQPPAQPGR